MLRDKRLVSPGVAADPWILRVVLCLFHHARALRSSSSVELIEGIGPGKAMLQDMWLLTHSRPAEQQPDNANTRKLSLVTPLR